MFCKIKSGSTTKDKNGKARGKKRAQHMKHVPNWYVILGTEAGEYYSIAECLPSRYKILGSIPNMNKNREGGKEGRKGNTGIQPELCHSLLKSNLQASRRKGSEI